MRYVAERLSDNFGVLEPYQHADTVAGELEELRSIIEDQCGVTPVTLLGHSWGAWLGFILAAEHPDLAGKLIMVGAGPFEERYSPRIAQIRLARLSAEERNEAARLGESLAGSAVSRISSADFRRFGELMSGADSFDALDFDDSPSEYLPEIYRPVWREACEMRRTGELLGFGRRITCPVAAIHGDHDPHPADGVRVPLTGVLSDFRFILLSRCGHYPWKERHAEKEFFDLITSEIRESIQ